MYMTVYGPSVRTSSAVYMAYTAPYTGCVHGHVRDVHTAVYTTRIRPRTRVCVPTCTRAVYTAVYTFSAVYTAMDGRLHSAYTAM